jgi:hypothetical protein
MLYCCNYKAERHAKIPTAPAVAIFHRAARDSRFSIWLLASPYQRGQGQLEIREARWQARLLLLVSCLAGCKPGHEMSVTRFASTNCSRTLGVIFHHTALVTSRLKIQNQIQLHQLLP